MILLQKGDTPQKAALRQLMQGYLKDNDISVKNGTDVNAIMRDMMSVILEGALDEELNEELGYSRYDYRNKDTNNSRNGHSGKTMHTSYGDISLLGSTWMVKKKSLECMWVIMKVLNFGFLSSMG